MASSNWTANLTIDKAEYRTKTHTHSGKIVMIG